MAATPDLFAQFREQFGEILASKFPFEWPGGRLPVVLKIEQPLGQRVEIKDYTSAQTAWQIHSQGPLGFQQTLNDFPSATADNTGRAKGLISATSCAKA